MRAKLRPVQAPRPRRTLPRRAANAVPARASRRDRRSIGARSRSRPIVATRAQRRGEHPLPVGVELARLIVFAVVAVLAILIALPALLDLAHVGLP